MAAQGTRGREVNITTTCLEIGGHLRGLQSFAASPTDVALKDPGALERASFPRVRTTQRDWKEENRLRVRPAAVDARALVDDAWRGPLPRDGSTCGAAVPLRPDQINETLQALGWFPSGVLELGDTAPAARPTATPSVPPSASSARNATALTGSGLNLGIGFRRRSETRSGGMISRVSSASGAPS